MTRLRVGAAAVLVMTCTVVLAGCSSSGGKKSAASVPNGASSASKAFSAPSTPAARTTAPTPTATDNSGKDPVATVKAGAVAGRAAKTVRIAGTGKDSGAPFALDVHYATNGSSGSATVNGTKFNLLVVDTVTYFKAPDAFWRQQAGANADQVLQQVSGKWVKVAANSPAVSEFSQFSDRTKFLDTMLSPFESLGPDDLTDAGRSSVDGVPTVTYRSTGTDDTTIDVAASGTPYLLKLSDPDPSDGGVFTLTDWNQPYTLAAPPASQVYVLPS